jgi:hypothetical protein
VKRGVLLAVAAAAAALAVGAAPAAATNECRGLMVCARVAGPWVLVPVRGVAPRPRAEYLLSCPRGYIAAGLDAELSDRQIDIAFDGLIGAPVTPGVVTRQAVVFTATYVGRGARIASFRPHLGCVPASGGGGRLPTAYHRAHAFPPGTPTVRHARDASLMVGTMHLALGCATGERLLRTWYATLFNTIGPPPPPALATTVSTSAAVSHGRELVTTKAQPPAINAGAGVQLGVVCIGGR